MQALNTLYKKLFYTHLHPPPLSLPLERGAHKPLERGKAPSKGLQLVRAGMFRTAKKLSLQCIVKFIVQIFILDFPIFGQKLIRANPHPQIRILSGRSSLLYHRNPHSSNQSRLACLPRLWPTGSAFCAPF